MARVKIPTCNTSREGRGGRVVPVAPGGISRQGREGRVGRIVASPRGRYGAEGPDGRVRLINK